MIDIPLHLLPPDAKEGSVLKKENGVYVLDPEEEIQRRARIRALEDALFE